MNSITIIMTRLNPKNWGISVLFVVVIQVVIGIGQPINLYINRNVDQALQKIDGTVVQCPVHQLIPYSELHQVLVRLMYWVAIAFLAILLQIILERIVLRFKLLQVFSALFVTVLSLIVLLKVIPDDYSKLNKIAINCACPSQNRHFTPTLFDECLAWKNGQPPKRIQRIKGAAFADLPKITQETITTELNQHPFSRMTPEQIKKAFELYGITEVYLNAKDKIAALKTLSQLHQILPQGYLNSKKLEQDALKL